jgi:hypothetical protein
LPIETVINESRNINHSNVPEWLRPKKEDVSNLSDEEINEQLMKVNIVLRLDSLNITPIEFISTFKK